MSYAPQFPIAPTPSSTSPNQPSTTSACQPPGTTPLFPGNSLNSGQRQAQYLPHSYDAYPQAPVQQFSSPPHLPTQRFVTPLKYLGTIIPNRTAPPIPYGVQKVAGYDPKPDAEAVIKATKGFGTNDELLVKTLTAISIVEMDALADYYLSKNGKKLIDVLDSETSSYFGMGIHALATGPLEWDIELTHKALAGIGTNEDLLTELILGRSTFDELHLLSTGYQHRYGISLVEKVKGDLSGKTSRLFLMALSNVRPPDSALVDQAAVAKDIDDLFEAGQGKSGTDEMVFCEILTTRSQRHLSAVIGGYGNKYKSLTKVIKSEFSGHMRSGLLHIVEGAKPKRDGQGIWRDAKLIDKAMVGFGTRDAQLVWRIVRAHWDPARMIAIKEAYNRRTRKTLESRVASETSGAYKKLMLELIEGSAKTK